MGEYSRYEITRKDARRVLLNKIEDMSNKELEEILNTLYRQDRLYNFEIVDCYDEDEYAINYKTRPIDD